MNISLSWLRDYIETDLTADEIAKILTSIGLEVGHISEFEAFAGGGVRTAMDLPMLLQGAQ